MPLKPMDKPRKPPTRGKAWTAKQEELLINLYPSMTSVQLASVLGYSVTAIKSRAALLRKAGRLSYKLRQITPEQRSFICDQHDKATQSEVAAILGLPVRVVVRECEKLNISYQKRGDRHHNAKYPDSDVALIRQLRDDYGLTFREIGEKFDISPEVCRGIYVHRITAADAIAREYLPR